MSTREFRYEEGTSSKFWRIEHSDCTCTVVFGRIGTPGQTQTKTYADEQAAQAACTKQIAEKLKKGYQEVTTSADGTASAPIVAASAAKAVSQASVQAATPAKAAVPEVTPVVESAPEITPPMPATFDLTPSLNLDARDWFWATWRNTPPLQRRLPAPFDKADALRRLSRVSNNVYQWSWNWTKQIPLVVSPEEASFWLHAMQLAPDHAYRSPTQIAESIADLDFTRPLSPKQAFEMVFAAPPNARPISVALLAAICTPEEILRGIVEHQYDPSRPEHTLSQVMPQLVLGFRLHVLPYLSLAERQGFSRLLTPYLDLKLWPTTSYAAGPPAFYLAAMLGGHNDLLERLIESWPDNEYTRESWSDYYQRPQEIIFGLNDPQRVEVQLRRLKLRLRKIEYVRALLAHTEFRALDLIADSIRGETNREDAVLLAETFALAVATEVAPQMLTLLHESKAPQVARSWLEGHPAHTIAGLLPLADSRGAQAEAATDLLQRFARRGYEALIAEALKALPDDAAARLRTSLLDQAQPSLKAVKLPAWLHPADLPPVIVGQHTLNVTQVDGLLRAMQRSKLDSPHPLVVAVKQAAQQSSLDTFAWSLFDMWLAEGAPSKDNWAMFALGQIGGDVTALKLAPMIRLWPGESQHQRAVNGLECLRAIGSDTALMQINGIAQKVKFKGLQQRAAECMERIAKERGLSRAQLEDRIVPDCDLDDRGERIFDFGPRQFRFVLGPEMKPMVRDPQGKLKPNLPAPNTKDDADKAAQALADWKLLKKQIGEVAGVQALRLEQAMVTGRRWPSDEFEQLLVRHPLMTHLVRTLIWSIYDDTGMLIATFRVTEDQSYADSADDSFTLAPDALVGLVHPLHLPADKRAAWGEILSDYEIVQPFPQLGRPIHHLTADELTKTEITRFNDLTFSAPALVFGLEKLGWVRDLPADGGGFSGHSKPFYQANVTAVVQYEEGVAVGWIVDAPDQKLLYVAFVPGIRGPEMWPDYKDRLALNEIDPVVISEVLGDLLVLAAKAK